MPGLLASFFVEELRCSESEAEALVAIGRRRFLGQELSAEDLYVRVQRPDHVGGIAFEALRHRAVGRRTRVALVQRSFDLIPLPASEYEAFPLEGRFPEHLMELCRYLLDEGEFTPLNLLHLIYAAFLHPAGVAAPPRLVRQNVLDLAGNPDYTVGNRLLLAYLVLSSPAVLPATARRILAALLRSREVDRSVKAWLARAAVADDAGRGAFRTLASEEGLLLDSRPDDPQDLGTVRALPSGLRHEAGRWLRSHT